MHSALISYFKRYRMEIGLAGLPAPVWPAGFQAVAWRPDLLDAHAEVLCRCFQGEVDAQVFPSLGNRNGCASLMAEIARRRAFIPEATWLIVGPDGACGTVSALRERGVVGRVANAELRGIGGGRRLRKYWMSDRCRFGVVPRFRGATLLGVMWRTSHMLLPPIGFC